MFFASVCFWVCLRIWGLKPSTSVYLPLTAFTSVFDFLHSSWDVHGIPAEARLLGTDPGFRFCLFLKGTATRTESAAAFILAVNSYTCILVSEVDDRSLLVFVELNHLKSGKKDLSIFPQRVIEA